VLCWPDLPAAAQQLQRVLWQQLPSAPRTALAEMVAMANAWEADSDSEDCPFRCVGCTARYSTSHESEALVEHLRLLLFAVKNIQRKLDSNPLLVNGTSMAVRALDAGSTGGKPVDEASTDPAIGTPVPPWPARCKVAVPAPAPLDCTPSKSCTALAGAGLGRSPSSTPRPGAISETGHYDLLDLLQGSQSGAAEGNTRPACVKSPPRPVATNRAAAPLSPPPLPPPSPPRIAGAAGVAEAPQASMVGASVWNSADRAAGRPVAMVPTLTMPGARGIAPPLTPEPDATPLMPIMRGIAPPTTPEPEPTPQLVPVPMPQETEQLLPPSQTAPPPQTRAADAEAHAVLNSVTVELQEGRILHSDAATRFTALIGTLPVGKLRCSALLNRAHCLVGMGKFSDALADIDKIINERAPGVDVYRWPKVWTSRGAAYRKLAQAAETEGRNPAELYARARADYERVLTIEPRNEDSIVKARRCLEQLDLLEQRSSEAAADGGGRAAVRSPRRSIGSTSAPTSSTAGTSGHGTAAVSAAPPFSGRFDEPPGRSTVSPEKADTKAGLATQLAGGDGSQEPVMKRRRLGRKSSHERWPPAEATGDGPVGDTGHQPEDFAQRGLRALGRECAAAGRVLFDDGAVQERHNGTSKAMPEAGNLPSTPPRGPCRRVFEIRSPLGDHLEVVTLDSGGAGGFPSSGASDCMVCSCRLRGHCKHVAAALCAVEREEISGGAINGSLGSSGLALARAGDPGARSRRDALERRLERKTIEELKSLLRANNQLLGGTKGELLRRVADGVIFGALPQCPVCKGHLHPEAFTHGDSPGMFRCKKLNRDKEHCGYEVRAEEVVRRPFIGAEVLY